MRYPIVIIGLVIAILISIEASARHGSHNGRHGARGGHHFEQMSYTFSESPFFAPPENCAECHNPLWDARGNDVSLYDDWSSTMMSQAARDPLWQAKVASEVLRNPKIGLQLQERCARCHTPMAEKEAQFNFQQLHLLNDGFLNPQHRFFEMAADGVSCTVCHQVMGMWLGTDESFSGRYVIDATTARPDRAIYGPYSRPFHMPMRRRSGFTPFQGKHVKRSELCAACHTLFIPVTDGHGNIIGESPEQTPYFEWQHSIYGDNREDDDKSCQQCHMPPAEGAVVISRMPHHLGSRWPFARHHFVGGNTFILKLLRDAGPDRATLDQRRRFDATIRRTLHQLQHSTADIRIRDIQATAVGLEFKVQVTNRTGHKLPTGIPIRRLWLHISVKDATGQVLFESGKPGPDGVIEGNVADVDPTAFEPHYEVISQTDEVQIYESILGTSDGEVTYALSRGFEHQKENRLLPMGFDKGKVPVAIRPHGLAATDDDFTGGGDTTLYRIQTEGFAPPLTIEVDLLYQAAGFAFIQDLLRFRRQSPLIERFSQLYRQAEKTPVSISRASATYAH